MIINVLAWVIATPLSIKFLKIKNKWVSGLVIAPFITLTFTLSLYLFLHLYTESNSHIDYFSIDYIKFIGLCCMFIIFFMPVNIYLILRR